MDLKALQSAIKAYLEKIETLEAEKETSENKDETQEIEPSNVWNESLRITQILTTLKQWQRDAHNLKRKGTSGKSKSRELEQSEDRVIALLSTPVVTNSINELIHQVAISDVSFKDVLSLLLNDAEPLVTVEQKSLFPLSISRKELNL